MRSMTGYAEKSFASPRLRIKVSIKSLNHRFFDWNYKGAPLGELENRLRALGERMLQRGRVEAVLDLDFPDASAWKISINEALLERILDALERASRRLGREVNLSVDNIFRLPQVIELERKELTQEDKSFIEKCFEQTLEAVLKERRREGRDTAKQVRLHLRQIKQSLRRIEILAKGQPRVIREKLKQRFQDLERGVQVQGQKMEEEATSLIQRADISEEIVRLRSHVQALEQWTRENREESAGRMLDFLSQEISREANTINSKSQSIQMTKESLAVKAEIESIRQHIQNIE
jgi:uncharacterized protein (TIGR00255 family)